ncbi:hypothetical protein FHR99_001303 [Litorivivens lipolytica]|uniref:DNA gyrase inhibitor YacG n=1 Tax=Litorivivens lipolytica TaxID=1524264 RepID=A0A7W4W578_9GAMM|nr:DNA gyrase inhibitor YacG [Litorivivens lipolytica]MBB3047067.1 hypothetical protein [Litorivivens lipolytica]
MPEINCPQCGEKTHWNKDNPFRPFCSEQCKNLDFIAWAHEERQIPGDSQVSDVFSEDLEKFE